MKCYGIGQPVHRIQKLFLETIMHHRCPHPRSLSSRAPRGLQEKSTCCPLCSSGQGRIAHVEQTLQEIVWTCVTSFLSKCHGIKRRQDLSGSEPLGKCLSPLVKQEVGGSFELCRYPAWLLLQVLGPVFSFQVFIEKQKGEILGVVIVESGWGSILPTVIIANMMHGGPAEKSGKLNIGDQIMSINGTSLVGLPLSTCQSIIKVPARGKATHVVHLRGVTCDCFSVVHLRNINEALDPEEGGHR